MAEWWRGFANAAVSREEKTRRTSAADVFERLAREQDGGGGPTTAKTRGEDAHRDQAR
jgi:hypothetical protein